MLKLKILENIEKENVSPVQKNDKKTLNRISGEHVGYMELKEKAGAFACGNCKWIEKNDHCHHSDVNAYVSSEHGCCNYFYPNNGNVVFPKNMKPRT